MWEEQLPVKTEAKKLLTTSVFSMTVVTRSPALFITRGGAKSAEQKSLELCQMMLPEDIAQSSLIFWYTHPDAETNAMQSWR